MKIPPYLKKGDLIGITCPGGYMAIEKVQACIGTLESWGYKIKTGSMLGKPQENYFAGSDQERLRNIQDMLNDQSVKAILMARGGYGTSRIIDNIDFRKFKKNPKWLIGFSDVTLLHTHVNKVLKTASIHAQMAAAFNDDVHSLSIQSLREVLEGKCTTYEIASSPLNQHGVAEGRLTGGNLALLAHSIGTKSEPDLKDKILFIEDIGEYIYSVDRMLWQIKRAGWFKKIKALIVGSFTDVKDTDSPFGKSMEEVIKEHLADYQFPYCFHFPVGHTEENVALKCGLIYKLTVQKNNVFLQNLE